jgi:hypothetical protein
LFAALWLVKAWNALGDEPLVADTVGGRSSKLNLDVEGGGRPLVTPSPVSSAIEVRTVIGRVSATFAASVTALGPLALPKQLHQGGALVALAGRIDGVQPLAESRIRLGVQVAVAVQGEAH